MGDDTNSGYLYDVAAASCMAIAVITVAYMLYGAYISIKNLLTVVGAFA